VVCAAVLRTADPTAFPSCSSIFQADRAKAPVASVKPYRSCATGHGVTSR
jgi:hypothetical protein